MSHSAIAKAVITPKRVAPTFDRLCYALMGSFLVF